MQVVLKAKALEREGTHGRFQKGLTGTSSTGINDVDFSPGSLIVRPNLRAPVTLPSFPITAAVTQILFLEIQILVPREILEIRIPVKLNGNSVCFAKCC